MLDVADDLERALAIVPAEKRVAASGSAEILSPLLQHSLSF